LENKIKPSRCKTKECAGQIKKLAHKNIRNVRTKECIFA